MYRNSVVYKWLQAKGTACLISIIQQAIIKPLPGQLLIILVIREARDTAS